MYNVSREEASYGHGQILHPISHETVSLWAIKKYRYLKRKIRYARVNYLANTVQ
jgi:hypothetical protein